VVPGAGAYWNGVRSDGLDDSKGLLEKCGGKVGAWNPYRGFALAP